MVDIHCEIPQIPVVDAQDPGAAAFGQQNFLWIMGLYKGGKAKFPGEFQESPQGAFFQYRADQ